MTLVEKIYSMAVSELQRLKKDVAEGSPVYNIIDERINALLALKHQLSNDLPMTLYSGFAIDPKYGFEGSKALFVESAHSHVNFTNMSHGRRLAAPQRMLIKHVGGRVIGLAPDALDGLVAHLFVGQKRMLSAPLSYSPLNISESGIYLDWELDFWVEVTGVIPALPRTKYIHEASYTLSSLEWIKKRFSPDEERTVETITSFAPGYVFVDLIGESQTGIQ